MENSHSWSEEIVVTAMFGMSNDAMEKYQQKLGALSEYYRLGLIQRHYERDIKKLISEWQRKMGTNSLQFEDRQAVDRLTEIGSARFKEMEAEPNQIYV